MLPEFKPFQKIPRWSRDIIITEKLDGTNASIYIPEEGVVTMNSGREERLVAASRNRWIFPENDNHGFAKWVAENQEELIKLLGPGHHFGEWWGAGIQRRYGLNEKRFSLFNVDRWKDLEVDLGLVKRVPVLYQGPNSEAAIHESLEMLRQEGSMAARGFMQPEGIVIYHVAAQALFKKTLEGDERPKGQN